MVTIASSNPSNTVLFKIIKTSPTTLLSRPYLSGSISLLATYGRGLSTNTSESLFSKKYKKYPFKTLTISLATSPLFTLKIKHGLFKANNSFIAHLQI